MMTCKCKALRFVIREASLKLLKCSPELSWFWWSSPQGCLGSPLGVVLWIVPSYRWIWGTLKIGSMGRGGWRRWVCQSHWVESHYKKQPPNQTPTWKQQVFMLCIHLGPTRCFIPCYHSSKTKTGWWPLSEPLQMSGAGRRQCDYALWLLKSATHISCFMCNKSIALSSIGGLSTGP